MSVSAFADPSLRVGLVAGLFLTACPRASPVPQPNDFATPGLAALGKQLFADRLLSRDSSISCASCHVPAVAFADTLPIADGIGADASRRNSPSLLNVDIHPHFGWDGRATTLREHLEHAFTERGDMGITVEQAAARLGRLADRRRAFADAGRVPDGAAVVDALVAYQMTLKEGDSRFDRFYLAGDSTALTAEEQRGWQVFRSLGCSGCHVPVQPEPGTLGRAVFSDFRFHNLGIGYRQGFMADEGRYLVTGEPRHIGAFKTPSLRNVALTPPYMHDGSIATLEAVVDFYARGGTVNPWLDPTMVPRQIASADRAALVAFLRSLTTNRDVGSM